MLNNWMQRLAAHYDATRRTLPDQQLLISFDIDGTIIDLRHMIVYVLKAYDDANYTRYFRHLNVDTIAVHENHIEPLLHAYGVPEHRTQSILNWYNARRWDPASIIASHRPFQGVIELIRWFQSQPNTVVALNTGRPESARFETMHSLNTIGTEYGVRFIDGLVHMNPFEWEQQVGDSKAIAIQKFRNAGFHIFAAIDNEPESLAGIARADENDEIMLLHAATLFETDVNMLPQRTISGNRYDLAPFVQSEGVEIGIGS